MEDAELAAIRAKRMAEMQNQYGGPVNNYYLSKQQSGGMAQDPEQKQQQQRQMEERRRNLLAQVLDQSARERLNRISIVKPDKGRAVEDLILQMAQTGQLRGKVNEAQLIDLLEQIRETEKPEQKKVVINRRRADLDEESDDDYGF